MGSQIESVGLEAYTAEITMKKKDVFSLCQSSLFLPISLNKHIRAAASLTEHSSQETEEKWWKDSQAETREKKHENGRIGESGPTTRSGSDFNPSIRPSE